MNKLIKLILLLLIYLLISCNDKPSELGVNLLPDTVVTKGISTLDTILIPITVSYKAYYPLFNYGINFIGKANGLTAITLSNFAGIPDTLGWLTEEKIDKVELSMYPQRYALGDTLNGILSFDIYKVARRWNPDTTNYDSLIISPANYFGEKIASFNGKIELKDTMDIVRISLPKSLIIDWFKTEMVYDTVKKDSVPKAIKNWGLAFVPTINNSVINSFAGNYINATKTSTIFVNYKDKKDTSRTISLDATIDVTFLDVPKFDSTEIIVFNGANIWTEIFFDLSMIPKFSGIHKAQLDLFLNEEKSFSGNYGLDSLIEANYFMNKNSSSTFQYISAPNNLGLYRFNSITSSVQVWNRTNGKGSIIIMPHSIRNQALELDKLVFYGLENPDPNKRPLLKVIYSLNPKNYLEK